VLNPSELEARAEEAAIFLRLLASRHRLMILCSLLAGELSVGALGRHGHLLPHRIRPGPAELYRLFCAMEA